MDLAKMLGIDKSSPEYIAALSAAMHRFQNARISHCANGCTNYHDPDTDEMFAGFGAAGCNEANCA